MERQKISFEIEGKEITLETGKIAKQASGSVLLHVGDTTVLATACGEKKASDEIDFLPLRVDYQEKFSAIGKTLGGFIKREGRPSTREVLISRLIDRSLRPMFEDGYYAETQVLTYVYSYDSINSPDVLSICAASAALAISDLPLVKPIGAVRVGFINEKFVINPSVEEMNNSKLDLVLAGTDDAILMIEGYCDFLTEDQILQAIDEGHKSIKVICDAISQWAKKVGKEKYRDNLHIIDQKVIDEVANISTAPILEALTVKDKKQREKAFDDIFEKVKEEFKLDSSEPKYPKRDVNLAFKKVSSNLMRKMVLDENKRIDGRKMDEIRPIDIETGLLGRTHGSGLFTRGETQAIAVCTLGGENMGQRYEDLHGEGLQRFYLQYFFPPFSVGEVGRSGPPGRREVGHGKLAERALLATLPDQTDFPYIIRLESNITESNGSSSMASVCGGCLALMDAGVPIKKPVSGIAMGLILSEDGKFCVLSDILGAEDALGDMDFKITGDENGITAFQMDIKVEGITSEIMAQALKQAKQGRIHILKKMVEVCPQPKPKLSVYAPKIINIPIKQSKIGEVIGPGGKQIRAIVEETGVDINISDDGIVSIVSSDQNAIDRAKEIVISLTSDAELGKVYKGKITSIKPFGLFVKIYNKEGLCHISELSYSRIDDINDFYKEGDPIEVKVIEIDDRGKLRLSHKALLEKPKRD
ncbi:MAG: polyribonucleotide nucleotidyltransferase [Parachlamydiales bacterium]|nr:polyribonucleotide nucleotidyltransferase [Parachlamydiales bacterium]